MIPIKQATTGVEERGKKKPTEEKEMQKDSRGSIVLYECGGHKWNENHMTQGGPVA